jgi:serine/threonine-protein kinase
MAKCFENKQPIPLTIISAVLCNALVGLHAAHRATDERGTLLEIVHRDVSPQNIMVGTDGSARVLDFGIAKAEGRVQQTAAGTVKGKYAYMAPEQLRGGAITPAADIFGIGVILWEMLAGHRRYGASVEMDIVRQLLEGTPPFPHDEPSTRSQDELGSEVFRGLEAIAVKAMGRRASERFATAKDMADAIEACLTPGSVSQVARWVEALAAEKLSERAALLAQIETSDASKVDLAHSGIDLLARVKEESHAGEFHSEGSSGVMRAAGPPPTDASGSGMMAHPPPNTKALTLAMIALFIGFVALVVFTLRNRDGAPVSNARAGGNVAANVPATVAIPAATSASVATIAPAPPAVPSAVASTPSAKVATQIAGPSPKSVASPPRLGRPTEEYSAYFEEGRPTPRGAQQLFGGGLAPAPRWQGAPARAATPAAASTAVSPSRAAKPDCDPPWTLGPDGTKHFRVECMQ